MSTTNEPRQPDFDAKSSDPLALRTEARPYDFPETPANDSGQTTTPAPANQPNPRVTRLIGSIGKTFISTGVLILAFVGYQLYGTGIQEAQAQDDLRSDFEAALEQAAEFDIASAPVTSGVPVVIGEDEPGAESETATTSPPSTIPSDWYALLFPEGGEEVARIEIPSIDVDKIVVEGVQVADLRKGPGRYASTAVPGESGNAAIAGHRTTYGAPFHNIDLLLPGDEIHVTNILGRFTYEVLPQATTDRVGFCQDFVPGEQPPVPEGGETFGHFIVHPNDTCVLDDWGDDRLTLTACHPKFSARERIIVTARLVGAPVDAPDRPESPLATDERLGVDEIDGEPVDPSEAAGVPGQQVGADPTDPDAPAQDDSAESESDEEVALQNPVAEDLDEGLGWDYSALPDAIGWAVAALSVWALAAILSRRLLKWPTYAVAFVPFAILMFRSFEQIDRVLPAY